MKLVNFASLDPAITESGRTGLGNASALDREIWDEFHADWERLALECDAMRRNLNDASVSEVEDDTTVDPNDFVGETRKVMTEQRIKQSFFRRAVLSSYRGRCCMSGLTDSRMLIASHIVPWSKDKQNRLNPSNGLCLSAIHDKAFDKGLIALSDNLEILLAEEIRQSNQPFIAQLFHPLLGKTIELPERFAPEIALVTRHRNEIFVDNRAI